MKLVVIIGFFGLLDSWFIGLLFRVLEKKKRKEKQRKNGTVNCIVLICLVFKIITVKK